MAQSHEPHTHAEPDAAFNPERPPELITAQVFNAPAAPKLADLKGKVVVLLAFQMLCPGSLRHSLPQAERLARTFSPEEVAVLGLHMVFENHKDMAPSLLEPFLKTENISIPVMVDAPGEGGVPQTMAAYGMQGTPSLLVYDRQGRLRRHYLGAVEDARLAAEIMALCLEAPNAPREVSLAIEQRLAAALVDPHEHHHHHDGDCCGGHHDHDHGHDHAHGHDHDHDHAHGDSCGCGHKP
jgi:hypothetical protein